MYDELRRLEEAGRNVTVCDGDEILAVGPLLWINDDDAPRWMVENYAFTTREITGISEEARIIYLTV